MDAREQPSPDSADDPSARLDGPPASRDERAVIEIVRSVLPGRGTIGAADTLVGLGFDSLATADLAVAIEERFGVRLAEADVEQPMTIAEIARHLDAARRRPRRAPARVDRSLGRSQRVARVAALLPFGTYARLRVAGLEHVPATGPVVLAANHRSMLDVPVMVLAAPRRVFFMAKRELYADPFRRRLWLELGGFPVDRSSHDIRSIDVARALLDRGEAVVLYPEGTRSKRAEMLPFLHGATWLALKTGAPLVPAGIIGTGVEPGWHGAPSPWLGKHVRVAFGAPIAEEREDDATRRRRRAEELSSVLARRIAELMRDGGVSA